MQSKTIYSQAYTDSWTGRHTWTGCAWTAERNWVKQKQTHTKHTSRVDGYSCTNRWKHSCDSSSWRTACWCLPSVIDELTGMACTLWVTVGPLVVSILIRGRLCQSMLSTWLYPWYKVPSDFQDSVFMVRYTDMQTDWHGSPTSHPYSAAHSGSPQYYTCSMYWVFV